MLASTTGKVSFSITLPTMIKGTKEVFSIDYLLQKWLYLMGTPSIHIKESMLSTLVNTEAAT